MFKHIKGSRRNVFIFKNFVIKIPSFSRWVSFIRGINENLEERYWYSADGSRKRGTKWNKDYKLAEIYYADRFGFILIAEKLDTSFLINSNIYDDPIFDPAKEEKFKQDLIELRKHYEGMNFYEDIDPRNVGYRGEQLLVLDYGYTPSTMDCYIGT
jgi:hypothetical protein